MGSGTKSANSIGYGEGTCKKLGHQYQWVDELNFNSYPGKTVEIVKSLRETYGGQFVKHVFCSRCGDYRAIKLKTTKELEKFIKMEEIKN